MTEEDFAEFSKKGIRELRRLAAKSGVKGPTTLNKEALLEEIRAIEENRKQPYVPAFHAGRPAKNINIVLEGTGQDLKTTQLLDIFTSYDVKSVGSVTGYFMPQTTYIDSINKVQSIITNNNGVLKAYTLSSDFTTIYKLRMGDKVTAELKTNINNDKYISEIIAINDEYDLTKFSKDNRPRFDGNIKVQDTSINLEDEKLKNVYLGTRNIIKYKKISDLTENFIKINSSKIFTKKFIMMMNTASEFLSLKKDDIEVFPQTKTYKSILKEFKLMVNYMKRCVEMGENVILSILDIDSLITFLNSDNSDDKEVRLYTFMRELFALSRDLASSGSLTVFAYQRDNNEIYDKFATSVLNIKDLN